MMGLGLGLVLIKTLRIHLYIIYVYLYVYEIYTSVHYALYMNVYTPHATCHITHHGATKEKHTEQAGFWPGKYRT